MTQTPAWTVTHASRMHDHWWWRPGWDVGKRFFTWHLTFLTEPALHDLVVAYQHKIRPFPTLDLIPHRWLHLTMQGVGFTHEVPQHTVDNITTNARERLANLPAPTVEFSNVVVRPEAIALPPHPVEAIDDIRSRIREAVADVCGDDELDGPAAFQPHLSIAYSNTDAPSKPIIEALASVTPSPVTVTVRSAALIELHRDNRMYEWRTLVDLPLLG